MDTTLILLCILAFAFAITHLESKHVGERVRRLADSEFLILGLICGPLVFGLLSQSDIITLAPLLSVVAGFLGFIIGIPLSFKKLRVIPAADMRTAFAIVTILGLAVTGGMAAVLIGLPLDFVRDPSQVVIAALTLGVGALVFSTRGVRSSLNATRSAGPLSSLLPVTAGVGRVVALLAFEIVIATERGLTERPQWIVELGGDTALTGVLIWNGIALIAALLAGLVFTVFVGRQDDRERVFVATIGLVMLASGVAHAMSFSPLGIGLIAGILVANISPVAPKVAAEVRRLQSPAYVVLLVLAGALWQPISGLHWAIPGAYVLVRIIALIISGGLGTVGHPRIRRGRRDLGLGLIGQSALPVAIAVNFKLVHDTPLTDAVVTALLAGAIFNKLWSTFFLRRLLRNAGETGRAEVMAPSAALDSRPADASAPHDPTTEAHV